MHWRETFSKMRKRIMKESTAAYEKTLAKMAKDHTLKMLSYIQNYE